MVKVKICGITNIKDAQEAVKAGADAVGFVFYRKSPRYISPEKAREIASSLPKKIKKIGVFANSTRKLIKDIADMCRLDMVQLHSDESPEFCRSLKGCKVIKSFRVKGRLDKDKIRSFPAAAYLFDTFHKRKFGGTGKSFKWAEAEVITSLAKTVFLSGGLDEKNVAGAVRTLCPDWVDVSSSVESKPGKKDAGKVSRFIKAAKSRKKQDRK